MSAEPYPLEQPTQKGRTEPSRVPLLVFLCNICAGLVYVVVLLHQLDARMVEVLAQVSTSTEYVLMKKEL